MKQSIFAKVFGAFFLVVVILSAFILAFSFKTIRSHYINTLTHDLKNLGMTLMLEAKPLVEKGRFEELDALTKRLGKDINTRITIIDPDGFVLADSEKNPALMENHKLRPEVLQVLNGDVGTSLRFSSTVQEEMLYVAQPIEQDGKVLGVLRVSLFLDDINHLLNLLKKNIAYVVCIIVFLSLLGALLFARSLSKPIGELSHASRKVASGDFNVRVLLKTKDELKELADSFNYMTERIQTLFTELSHQKEGLNNIISSIQEGLLVLDKQGRVTLTNESVRKIVQNNQMEGRFHWEVIREPLFIELIKKVRDEKRNHTEELILNGKYFLCSATLLDFREETAVIFHDITDMKKVEEIKKDFVVNVSHELRTPLTAIKGFAETLEDETDEKNRHYVDIIKRNTDRLINIVQDLLALSQLEERGTRLELEKVDLNDMIERTFKIFEHRLREKNLAFDLKMNNNLPLIKADPFKLEQVFINLIDNAIKYTEQGEITLSLMQSENQVMIEIKDTGIGIAENHIPRIFERFYVTDKSRSKMLGGTGLGLSIVKHIVLLHNGTIDVKSMLNKGTTFTITLPINPS